MAKHKIKVDGASIHLDSVSRYKTEAEFIAATPEHLFAGPNREAKLKQVWAAAGIAPVQEAPTKKAAEKR